MLAGFTTARVEMPLILLPAFLQVSQPLAYMGSSCASAHQFIDWQGLESKRDREDKVRKLLTIKRLR